MTFPFCTPLLGGGVSLCLALTGPAGLTWYPSSACRQFKSFCFCYDNTADCPLLSLLVSFSLSLGRLAPVCMNLHNKAGEVLGTGRSPALQVADLGLEEAPGAEDQAGVPAARGAQGS